MSKKSYKKTRSYKTRRSNPRYYASDSWLIKHLAALDKFERESRKVNLLVK